MFIKKKKSNKNNNYNNKTKTKKNITENKFQHSINIHTKFFLSRDTFMQLLINNDINAKPTIKSGTKIEK